jgi:hypothetical protein
MVLRQVVECVRQSEAATAPFIAAWGGIGGSRVGMARSSLSGVFCFLSAFRKRRRRFALPTHSKSFAHPSPYRHSCLGYLRCNSCFTFG